MSRATRPARRDGYDPTVPLILGVRCVVLPQANLPDAVAVAAVASRSAAIAMTAATAHPLQCSCSAALLTLTWEGLVPTGDERGAMSTRSERAAIAVEEAIDRAIETLEQERDPFTRARVAMSLVERMRRAQEEFGDQRTVAFLILREEYDCSLADLSREFGIARARAAQIINRDAYKVRRRLRGSE